jgi:hypothetical protein
MKRAVCLPALAALCAMAKPAPAAPLVSSDSECPSAPEVAALLAGLSTGNDRVGGAAHIRIQGGQMIVELNSEIEPAASRILPAEPDCGLRAQAAALVISAWLDSAPGEPLAVESTAVLPAQPRNSIERTTTPRPPRLWLGLGALGSLDMQGAGGVLSGEVAWARLVGRMGMLATITAPLPRETSVGQGTAGWWRPVLALAARVPLFAGSWIFEGTVGPAFGLLMVSGRGFDQNHTNLAPSWGATAGVRLARRHGGRWAYWAELRGMVWPVTQSIRNDVQGQEARLTALPRIEMQAGLGFSFGVL